MTDSDLMLAAELAAVDMEPGALKVTALGGGHGLAVALQAILDFGADVTAVVGVSDDGGSTGRLSPALAIPPMGDIRRALVALSPEPSLWRLLMEYRFDEGGGDVAGHSLGNLLIAALTELTGGFQEALDTLGRLLEVRGSVVPASGEPLTLEADVAGKVVRGQVAIATGHGPITAVRVVPDTAVATGRALDAIAAADVIVLGPGSLFTSVIAGLRVPGIAEAITTSAASLVYVSNLITQDGETLALDGDDHIHALINVGGVRPPDVVVAHDGPLAVPPGLSRVAPPQRPPGRVITGDLADPGAEWPAHDPARLGAVLRQLA